MWKYFNILQIPKSKTKCVYNICNISYGYPIATKKLKTHLFIVHEIIHVQNKLLWKDKSSLLWRYFIQGIPKVTCTIYNKRLLTYCQYKLHLSIWRLITQKLQIRCTKKLETLYNICQNRWLKISAFNFINEYSRNYLKINDNNRNIII